MKVLNFGSLNIDYTYLVDHMTVKGETQTSNGLTVQAGGKGLNQSIALAKAGANVYHAGAMGEDGLFLKDLLEKYGVNTDHVKLLTTIRSGNALIQNDKTGDNCILLYPGANRAITEEQVAEVFADFETGDYLVLQNEINQLPLIVKTAKEKGMKVVLNPSPLDDRIFELPLDEIDYFILNEIEAGQLLAHKGLEATIPDASATAIEGFGPVVDLLRENFPNTTIVMTAGIAGSVYDDGLERVYQTPYKVKAVDTTAAGDTFSGYFLTAIIEGRKPADAMDLASRASSITVTRPGAADAIPLRKELVQN